MLASMDRPQDITYTKPVDLDAAAPINDSLPPESRTCPGCKKSAVSDNGGLVVAFGQAFFHVNCFRCAKCSNQVTADTNLLLLSDGSPICANCSYTCSICQLPILDEAIMTGDDSYHAHCFKCKVCKNRIDELVFAKTSQGIYCMDCHNERMARIRKHNERKRERTGGSSSSRSRHKENGHPTSPFARDSPKSTPSPSLNRPGPRTDGSYFGIATETAGRPSTGSTSPTNANSSFSSPSSQPAVTVAPPADEFGVRQGYQPRETEAEPTRPLPTKQSTYPSVNARSVEPLAPRRKSQDDREDPRPLSQQFPVPPGAADHLNPVESVRSKRRSINPGLTLNNPTLSTSPPASSSSPTLSPLSANFANRPPVRSPSPRRNGQGSPMSSGFQSASSSMFRTGSNSSSVDGHNPAQMRSTSSSDLSHEHGASGRPPLRHAPTMDQVSTSKVNGTASPSNGGDPDQHGPTSAPPTIKQHPPWNDPPDAGNGNEAYRPPSRAEVPHSVESTDSEGDEGHTLSLPPKQREQSGPQANGNRDADASRVDDESDSESPVEATSHATFIAPALPPIRFSLNTDNFAELFDSVGGAGGLKSLQDLQQESQEDAPLTPPPSASSFVTASSETSTSHSTITGPTSEPSPTTAIDPAKLNEPPTRKLSTNGFKQSSSELKLNGKHEQLRNGSSNRELPAPPSLVFSAPDSSTLRPSKSEEADIVHLRLHEALADAQDRGAQQLKLDRAFVEAIFKTLSYGKTELEELRSKFDGVKRASKQYIDGLTVAQTEYDRELKGRRDAEAEVTRLRVLLSGQTARLTALSGDSRRQELQKQISKEMHESLSGLERDLSQLKVQRDMTIAEMEELAASKASPIEQSGSLSRTLSVRLDKLKGQYQHELLPLTQQREALLREITELKAARDVFLEETTVLNARNEELAQLSAQYARRIDTVQRMEAVPETPPKSFDLRRPSEDRLRQQGPFAISQSIPISSPMQSQLNTSTTSVEDQTDRRFINIPRTKIDLPTPSKGAKFIKWPGSASKEVASAYGDGKGRQEHNFQQLSVLRFARCDHCGDKMWGSQLRCTACNVSVHVRCINHVHAPCNQQGNPRDDLPAVPLPPSMFGRDLIEQVHADSKGTGRLVPVIVEKCIDAVEVIALDYEGIYRKTGGSGQSKIITQLFERGDYNAFDLRDTDRFNDVCSITSVLKTYFRSLPTPLLTYDLHDHFMSAVEIRETALKDQALSDLVKRLPSEHYHTVRMLMLHLHRIFERCEQNLMNARNLGVVFGPTLMRSRNPGAEFSDMAGKALTVEWLVEKAPHVFGLA